MDSEGEAMTPQTMTQVGKRWKAGELRKLPPEQRDAIA